MTDEELARIFHEAYERLAPDFGYKTREASAVPWEEVPEANRNLMIAVAGEVRAALEANPPLEAPVVLAEVEGWMSLPAIGALHSCGYPEGWGEIVLRGSYEVVEKYGTPTPVTVTIRKK